MSNESKPIDAPSNQPTEEEKTDPLADIPVVDVPEESKMTMEQYQELMKV